MGFQQKLQDELVELSLAFLYFGCWIAVLLLIKQLLLADYQIEFNGFSMVVIGALVLSKVVLILEHIPLGSLLRGRPTWVAVLLRTALYALGVFVILLLEKAFEGRHEFGGFGSSLASIFQHADLYHVWVNAICMTGALLVYNTISVIRSHLGKGGLLKLYLQPLPEND